MPKVFMKGCKIKVIQYGDHCQGEDFRISLQKIMIYLISTCVSKVA